MTRLADVNGDGLADMVYGGFEPGDVQMGQVDEISNPHYACPVDQDPDNPNRNRENTWRVRLSTNGGTFGPELDTGIGHGCNGDFMLLDADGSGTPELLFRAGEYDTNYTLLKLSFIDNTLVADTRATALPLGFVDEPFTNQEYRSPLGAEFKIADLNGDGRVDVLRADPSANRLYAYFNLGNPLVGTHFSVGHDVTPAWPQFPLLEFEKATLIDVDRDGRADLMGTTATGNPELHDLHVFAAQPAHAPLQPATAPAERVSVTPIPLDANNDGVVDFIFAEGLDGAPVIQMSGSEGVGDFRVSAFQRGDGVTTHVEYAPLNAADPQFYEPTWCSWPERCVPDGRSVVRHTSVVGPEGVDVTTQYRYGAWKNHLPARTALGFRTVQRSESWRGELWPDVYTTEFDNDLEMVAGVPISRGFRPTVNSRLTYTESALTKNWSGKVYTARVFTHPNGATTVGVETQRDASIVSEGPNEEQLELVRKTDIFVPERDEHGRPLTTESLVTDEDSGDGHWTWTTSAWDTNEEAWLLNMQVWEESTTCEIRGLAPPDCTVPWWNEAGFDTATGAVDWRRGGPLGHGPTKRFVRDEVGNIIARRSEARDAPPRVEHFSYDPEGVFVTCAANAAGHTTVFAHDRTLGLVTATKDANGAVSQTQVDEFGRIVLRVDPSGYWRSFVHGDAPAAAPGFTLGHVTEERADSSRQEITLSHRGLPQSVRTTGFDGTWVYTLTSHDARGRTIHQTRPFHEGEEPRTALTASYDALGRLVRRHIDGSDYVAITYDRAEVTHTWVRDDVNSTRRALYDARGLIREIEESDGAVATYTYDAAGQLSFVESEGGWMDITRDDFGFPTTIEDADRGLRMFDHDDYGQRTLSIDAKGQVITHEYDALGRRTLEFTDTGTTTWSYDEGVGAIGSVTRIERAGVVERFSYTPIGQPKGEDLVADGYSFLTSRGYDSIGRFDWEESPSHGGRAHRVTYGYNPHGFLDMVNLEGNGPLWRALSADPEGRVETSRLGTSVSVQRRFEGPFLHSSVVRADATPDPLQDLTWIHRSTGHLSQRIDAVAATTELFDFDSRSRVEGWTLRDDNGVDPAVIKKFGYDLAGNMTARGDLLFEYSGARPHAVSGHGDTAYIYDPSGNLHTRLGPDALAIEYNAHHLPTIITEGQTETTFDYTGSLRRFRKDSEGYTTWYAPGFERRDGPVGSVAIYPIHAGGEMVAEVRVDQVGNRAISYVVTDGLGSPTLQLNAAGCVEHHYRHLPFGEREQVPGPCAASALTTGFTGHEHDASTGLVNMVMRQYDPTSARFTSPDPLLGNPYDLARLNPYTYAHNQPTRWVDPLGMEDTLPCYYFIGGECGGASEAGETAPTPTPTLRPWIGNPNQSSISAGTTPVRSASDFRNSDLNYALYLHCQFIPIGFGCGHGIRSQWEQPDGMLDREQFIIKHGGYTTAVVFAIVEPGPGGEWRLIRRLWLDEAEVLLDNPATSSFVVKLATRAPEGVAALPASLARTARTSGSTAHAKSGSTLLGHSLQKHGGRNPSTWGGGVRGTPASWHGQGLKHFDDIIQGPGAFERVTNDRGITFLEKRLPDGRGLRLNLDHTFKGFID